MFYNIDTTSIKDPATGMIGMEAQKLQTSKNKIKGLEYVYGLEGLIGHYDTHHNDTQVSDILHNKKWNLTLSTMALDTMLLC